MASERAEKLKRAAIKEAKGWIPGRKAIIAAAALAILPTFSLKEKPNLNSLTPEQKAYFQRLSEEQERERQKQAELHEQTKQQDSILQANIKKSIEEQKRERERQREGR